MKKLFLTALCTILAFVMAISIAAFAGENYVLFSENTSVDIPINEHIAGDANGNGKIDLLDVIAVLRYMTNNKVNTLRDGVDVNSDGKVSVMDAVILVNYVIGNDENLGILVNSDGTVKEDTSDKPEAVEYTVTVINAASDAETKLSSLEINADGIFLGWFTSEEAATALDVKFAAADGYEGTVYGALVDANLAYSGADMFASEPYGVRFTSKIDRAAISAIEKVNALNCAGNGGSFTPANEWKNGIGYGTVLDISVELSGDLEKSLGKTVRGGVCVPAVYTSAIDDTTLSYTATALGIDTASFADKITARPYLTYVDANGNEHTVYANGGEKSFYLAANEVANDENAAEEEKNAAANLLSTYKGGSFTSTLGDISKFNLSSENGSADNDNAYVELDRTTMITLDENSHYRYQNAFYPRITKVKDNLFLMTYNYSQLGRHLYYTTSTDGVNWAAPSVLYSADAAKNKFTYESGSLKGEQDDFIAATADHCVLDDGTVMCVYSRRARNGYGSNEYTGLHTLEVVKGTVSGSTIEWSTPTSVYHGHSWEPDIIQRENGTIEIYWSHSAPMIEKYGFNEDMRSSGVAMISSTDGGNTWTPNVPADDDDYAGKRIYQYNAGKFTLDNGTKVNFYHGQMPGVVELVDGRMAVIAETRTTSRSYHMISLARSEKNGEWKELGIDEAGPSDVIEDNFKGAAPTLMRFDSGELLVTYNANRDGSNMMYARLLDKTGSDIASAYELNPFYTTSTTDSGFWSASAPVDSHTAILAMSYKKYKGLEPETSTNENGEEVTTLHNTTVVGQVRLNHTIDATKKNMVADGNLQEWKDITDALFVGSLSSVQATYRFAYDEDYIYVAVDRIDSSNSADDTNYIMIATESGSITAKLGGDNTLPSGVTAGTKTAVGGKVCEFAFDRAALGLTGDYIRVNPGFTDAGNNVDDRINGTVLSDTSSWIKINLK